VLLLQALQLRVELGAPRVHRRERVAEHVVHYQRISQPGLDVGATRAHR
jgi:hypothetical protein